MGRPLNRHHPKRASHATITFIRREPPKPDTPDEVAAKQRAITEWLKRNKVKKCKPGGFQ